MIGDSHPPARISIIIPTLNESASLPAVLREISREDHIEILVVDGGSQDDTAAVARSCGAQVLSTSAGRAFQMNAGAAISTGEILLFLHGDTLLAPGYATEIRRIMQVPGVVAGAFRFAIPAPGLTLRLIEKVTNLRSRLLQMPYGDQAIFLQTSTFHDLGGFPDLPIMEDFELVRRLRRKGRIEISKLTASTSGRRWQALGPWRTTFWNQIMIAGYLAGISVHRLAMWYRGRHEDESGSKLSTGSLLTNKRQADRKPSDSSLV